VTTAAGTTATTTQTARGNSAAARGITTATGVAAPQSSKGLTTASGATSSGGVVTGNSGHAPQGNAYGKGLVSGTGASVGASVSVRSRVATAPAW
jgi:hypothetical protein